jgi:P4 family phage/plasmid primase-like protien
MDEATTQGRLVRMSKKDKSAEPEWLTNLKLIITTGLCDGAPVKARSVIEFVRSLQNKTTMTDDQIVAMIVGGNLGQDEASVRSMLAGLAKLERTQRALLIRGDWTMAATKFVLYRAPTLVRYGGDFLAWSGGSYQSIHDDTVQSQARKFLRDSVYKGEDELAPCNPDTNAVRETLNAIKDYHHLAPSHQLPMWRDDCDYGGATPTPSECIAFPNGILHVPTGDFIPQTCALLNRNCLEFEFDPDAPSPALWLATLKQYWPEPQDQDCVDTLQEWFGYCLTQDTGYQKALFLLGPRRSGKGLISRILRMLIGISNSVSTSLNSLGGEFGLAPLIAKLFALVGETKFGAKTDRTEVTRRLLSIIGEDGVDINRKNKDFWDGVILLVRFMFLGNEVPRFDDSAGAMAARLIILKMTATFDGVEDITLEDRLVSELPGILLWALEGLDRLRARGRFVEPKSSADAKRLVRELASPVTVFVAECCVLDPIAQCSRDDLYKAYRRHCDVVGIKHPLAQNLFFAELDAAFQEHIRLFRAKVTGEAGKVERPRAYRGIRLVPDSEMQGVPF